MGLCKKGSRTCANGIPGTCVGAVGPQAEQCDDLDHDCNGKSGNQGDTVPNAPIWYKDTDNDSYGDMSTTPKQVCKAPDTTWKQSIPNTDCNDNDPSINPGHAEVCDGKDNNCNGTVDEGVTTPFCLDADNDSYCTAACTSACTAPTNYRAQSTCVGTPGNDCNDGNTNINPGHAELCNGIDDNCNNQIDEGYNVGQACVAGSAGVCKRNGTNQCSGTASTACSPGAGTANANFHSTASTDTAIYTGSDSASYQAKWDWNCDGTTQGQASGAPGAVFGTYLNANYVCEANYQAACRSASTPAECKFIAYPCPDPCGGVYCQPAQACGKTVTIVGCLWGYNGSNPAGCDTYTNFTGTWQCE
jgi:hypothetical protein